MVKKKHCSSFNVLLTEVNSVIIVLIEKREITHHSEYRRACATLFNLTKTKGKIRQLIKKAGPGG